jgi:site-specific DNA-methyltransferase (adenine-specific)
MIWHKVCGTPAFCGDRFAKGCEAIVVASATTSCDAIVVAHPFPPGRKHWNGGGKHGFYEHQIVIEQVEPRFHTAQKPLPLMLELVNDFSDPGELIYDACMGSGTTGIACLRGHGGPRRFIGIERERHWADIAAERIDAEIAGTTVAARRAGQLAMFADTG